MFDGDFHEIHDGVAKMVEAALAMIWNPIRFLNNDNEWNVTRYSDSKIDLEIIMSLTHTLLISAYLGLFYSAIGDRYIGDMCSACLAIAFQFDQAFVKVKIFTFILQHGSRTMPQS